MIYTDGLSITGLRGVGIIITSPEKDVLKYGVQIQFLATNIKVEYKAILTSLRIARTLGIKNLRLRIDSKLIVG